MEITFAIVLIVVALIIGWFLHKFFGKPKTVEVTKIVEVLKVVNQVQVAEVVMDGNQEFIKGFDYYNRKAVITKKYNENVLSQFKNGDIFLYTGEFNNATLILNTVSIA